MTVDVCAVDDEVTIPDADADVDADVDDGGEDGEGEGNRTSGPIGAEGDVGETGDPIATRRLGVVGPPILTCLSRYFL